MGLMPGAILWRPKARPESSAPTSQNFDTAISQTMSSRPLFSSGPGMTAMRERKESMNGT